MAKKTGRPRLYANARDRQRACRARRKAEAAHQLDFAPPTVPAVDHADPVGELATWAAETLIVPPGHPRAGEPMALPDFAVAWLRASWDAHESALSTARKNAKSAIAAVVCLGYLCGPLRRPGWRGAVASLDKGKAGELRRQVAEIAKASGLDVKVRRSPYPGVIESSTGSLDTLSADRTAGHASGYDLVIVDETGLFPLRARDLLAGLRSSVSARNGQIRHISIRGNSPLFREILENPSTATAVYAAPAECNIDDEAAWRAANPGLGTIKALDYMRAEVERVAGVPSDEPSFRAYDLNLALSPTREMVCTPSDLEACFVDVGGVSPGRVTSVSTSVRRRAGRRRLPSGRRRARCGRGSRLGTCRIWSHAGGVTVPTMPRWSGVANCGPIRGAPCRLTCSCCRLRRTWTAPRFDRRWRMATAAANCWTSARGRSKSCGPARDRVDRRRSGRFSAPF